MEKFRFYQDVQVTVWVRQSFTIEAENKEEALKEVERFKIEDVTSEIDEVESETLWETEERMLPENCGGLHTIELFDDHDNFIGHNAQCYEPINK